MRRNRTATYNSLPTPEPAGKCKPAAWVRQSQLCSWKGSGSLRLRSCWLSGLAAVLIACCYFSADAVAQTVAPASPRTLQTEEQRLAPLDAVLKNAIDRGDTPGAVLLVEHNGAPVYRKAFGSRALDPAREAMTVDTIFDLASLTKVVATTTCVLRLVQLG